jgi:hypothetical protein
MVGRIVSFSIKPRDTRAAELIAEAKRIVTEKNLHSFSTLMIDALREHLKTKYDSTN